MGDIGGYEAQARNPVAESAMGNIYNKNRITESLHYKLLASATCMLTWVYPIT